MCFLFYDLELFCGPSISADFQLTKGSDVKFKYFVAGLPFEGKFKVVKSNFDINFLNPVESDFSVEFDLMRSNAGFPSQQLQKQVLDAYKYPSVIFESVCKI